MFPLCFRWLSSWVDQRRISPFLKDNSVLVLVWRLYAQLETIWNEQIKDDWYIYHGSGIISGCINWNAHPAIYNRKVLWASLKLMQSTLDGISYSFITLACCGLSAVKVDPPNHTPTNHHPHHRLIRGSDLIVTSSSSSSSFLTSKPSPFTKRHCCTCPGDTKA